MRAEWRDSLEHLYPDSVVGEKAKAAMTLDVARGGTAAAHVLLNGLREGEALRLSVKEAGRGVREAKWFVLIDVPVERNTGPVGFIEREGERNEFVTRRAPFRVYDAMSPAGATVRATAGTMGLRLHVPVALDARAGRRRYEVGIRHGDEEVALGLTVDVHRVRLPGVGEKSWPYTNWFSYELIAQRHGLTLWSEPYWRMLRKYAQLMAHGRQNTFLTPLGAIFRSSEKGVVLDAGRLRRIVKLFTDAGMHWIEGGHWAGRTGNEWLAKTFDLSIGTPKPLASSPEGAKVMATAGRQLMAEIEKQGWRGRWLQHVADEPIGDNATDYRLIAGMVRRYMPGVPILDATMERELVGAVDCWCPQAQWYQKQREHFEEMRRLGDRVWFYTCCFPGGPWLNRLLDMELIRPALLGWAGAMFGLDGFLHWGLNQYKPTQDPFKQSVVDHGGGSFLPGGDTHIVYPGPGADGPWSSVRLEAQREGCEDYELLRMLGQRNPRAARAAIRAVIQGFDQYTKDVGVLRAARRRVLTACGR